MILAGDIGGTKTVLAIYSAEGDGLVEHAKQRFVCAEYEQLSTIVGEFLDAHDELRSKIESASFGVAGPIRDGRCDVTNLPWVVDADKLREEFGFSRAILLNDLESIATSIPFLKGEDIVTLNQGEPVTDDPIGVVAPGTGLGEAYLTKCGSDYVAHASEGGHCDLSPGNEIEMDLVRYLQDRFGHASLERAVSGEGIANIYAFLKERGDPEEPDWLRSEMEQPDDPAPIVERYASGEKTAEICVKTMDIFVRLLGAEAGNLALKLLPRGGIYLGGGIPPIILPLLKGERFMEAFLSKGRMRDLAASMPIYVIVNSEPALLGAAWAAVVEK